MLTYPVSGDLTLSILAISNPSGNVNVIIFEKDLFDYSQGEPAEGMLTVLRALEVRLQYPNILSTVDQIR